ncbi:XapX domain-containing protein [Ralstonia solanacearum]|uniref:ABC transporter substrate-binding protein n=1 Tax=Ralstonia solanacearum TaxID=305 RepID=A0AAD0S8N7_RALSL|nr:XapX domain-containing protein [Ralstonia solanacearum]AXV82828.1 ABC transporter substrate-binding protein [Ralstonia solanacearum]AXW53946.1 ABC transporter substrate-binding protein [Ralstonia solanacearum]
MKPYLISLSAGVLVGIIYALLHVRSPAPPASALVGLLGMLIGEQIVPTAQRLLAGEPLTMAWFRHACVPKITGAPSPKPADDGVGVSAADRNPPSPT